MALRFLTLCLVSAAAAVAAGSSGSSIHLRRQSVTPGTSRLHAFGVRGTPRGAGADAKFDGALADIARHLSSVRAGHELQDLHQLHPGARFHLDPNGAPLVSIDAATRGDPQQLKAALQALGLQHAAVYSNDVGGWLPVNQLEAATQRGEVLSLRAAMYRTRAGSVTTQGDFVQHSNTVRSANSLTGAGVTVGVISDSYDCYAQYAANPNTVPVSGYAGYAYNGFTATAANDIASGDLPSTVSVLKEADCLQYGAPLQTPFGDEGRAMMQIVHDVAPGAALAFYTAVDSEADFANGIGVLAEAGAKVIADDVGYFDEPFFQDGLVAQAIDTAAAGGVAYFTAAGNNGSTAYDNASPDFSAVSTSAPNAGEHLLNFAANGATASTSLPVTIQDAIAPGEFVAIVVQWDQPYVTGAPHSGGAANQIDVCLTGVSGNDDITDDDLQTLTTHCTGVNSLGADPYQVILVGNPASASAPTMTNETFNIQIGLKSGTAPGRIKVAVEGNGYQLSLNDGASGGTLQGHSSAAGAATVGAAYYLQTPACGTIPATLEYYSSIAGDPMLFDSSGDRLSVAGQVVRSKPDFVAPDGGSDTFLGQALKTNTNMTVGCQNSATLPNFLGTSAATPHAAGMAALLLQANPALTPSEIIEAMRDSALPMTSLSSSGYNYAAGFGLIQADAAATMITAAAPAAPDVSLAASSIVLGASTTISWNSANTTGCMASGSWSGALASNGTQTLTPGTGGTDTYSLVCSNSTGASPAASAILTVKAAASASGSHGGGAMGVPWLAALAALALAASARRRPDGPLG